MKANENMHQTFYCKTCDYGCSKKSCWNQHILTAKHTKANIELIQANKIYACENCNIKFKHQSSYCRHRKKCTISLINKIIKTNIDEQTDKELIILLLKQNTKIMEQNTELLEVIKNGATQNSHNTTTNSHNKSFNLNFFLNETCKDAMNIMEFVDSIKLQLSDLENVGKIGYVEGISNIIVKNLNDLDVTERPIHCTDKKREVLYVKDDNKWEKEDEEKKKIKKVIKHVANKNIRLLQKFKEAHPDCGKSTSKFSDQYDKIIVEAMGGSGDNDSEKEEKIIHNISKNVTIDTEV